MKTLFKGGMIYDGSGRRPFKGDVLIEDDRIVKVAENIDEKAGKTVDISGYQICPGLIDAHSHNDFFYDREDAEKFYKPFIEQGITTQVTGNCSFSPFGMDKDTPYRDKDRRRAVQLQESGKLRGLQEARRGQTFCEYRSSDRPGLGKSGHDGL